jgi:superfamily II DNA or RNA helicase
MLTVTEWLKHPKFLDITPEEVLASWNGNFAFTKEDAENKIDGLRPPQLGALYSILAHLSNPDNIGIVVLPTGTGKTETMLCTLVANQCNKVIVAVPSDSLRTQIADKFASLGLLRKFKAINSACHNPIVGILYSGVTETEEINDILSRTNVLVTTMSILSNLPDPVKNVLKENVSHLFVDEAHHSKAETWENFIDLFPKKSVFLFTATPYRNDGKKLSGKFIFTFSLRSAQEQKYYKKINYFPIREYDKKVADKMIAEKAVEILHKDQKNNHKHIILARCLNKNRANEVFEHYQKYGDLNPVLIYTNIPEKSKIYNAIKRKEHSIIVCVDMLGEGFDLPELKIAAIHDERQSLPITLQFIGRFTRSPYDQLGDASFITNIAYPPIKEELDQLYAKDADWNMLLPNLSEGATQKEIDFKSFLEGFRHLDNSVIPFQKINPALSTVVYKNELNEWKPTQWEAGINKLSSYEHYYSDYTPEGKTLVIILGKVSRVEWGDFDTVQNLSWDVLIVFWDLRPGVNRVFINTSLPEFSSERMMLALFGDKFSKITGMDVFRIFHNVYRLSLFNVGVRRGLGQDISFQSFFGKGVQDGLKMLEQGTLIKNNIFGVGYKNGEKVSLGCSVKGKVWSYLRGNLSDFTEWCKAVGEAITNEAIDPNAVLEHTMEVQTISDRPSETLIAVDWYPEMYEFKESRFEFYLGTSHYFLWDIQIEAIESNDTHDLCFSIETEDRKVTFRMNLGEKEIDGKFIPYHKITKTTDIDAFIKYGAKYEDLEEYLQKNTPIFLFADGGHLFQNQYVKPRERPSTISMDDIIEHSWKGVSLKKESQGVTPYVEDSIQFHFIQHVREKFELIYDDDGKGEIADIIGINDGEQAIEIHLFHLKFAKDGVVSNDIENFYQVCGQAQKAINWKYKSGKDFFEHLFRRKNKTQKEVSCSRLIKGTEDQLEKLLNAAKWTKALNYHMYIVQPGFSKKAASESILVLLGNTSHYLHTVGNIDLKVYSS